MRPTSRAGRALTLLLANGQGSAAEVRRDRALRPGRDGGAADPRTRARASSRDDRITYLRGFGKADDSGRPVTPQTPFIIGSLSKSFTATGDHAARRGREGRARRARTALPALVPRRRRGSFRRITVRHLLNQTSGLSTKTGRTFQGNGDTSDAALEKTVRKLSTVELTAPVGKTHQYSTINYAVLGLIVQTVAGRSYESYVQTEIFDPLQMRDSFTSEAAAEQHGLATGYHYWFGRPRAADLPYNRGLVPAGYLISSAEDMTHYLIAQLNGGRYRTASVLSPEGVDELHRPAVATPKTGTSYAMGWFVGPINGIPADPPPGRDVQLPRQRGARAREPDGGDRVDERGELARPVLGRTDGHDRRGRDEPARRARAGAAAVEHPQLPGVRGALRPARPAGPRDDVARPAHSGTGACEPAGSAACTWRVDSLVLSLAWACIRAGARAETARPAAPRRSRRECPISPTSSRQRPVALVWGIARTAWAYARAPPSPTRRSHRAHRDCMKQIWEVPHGQHIAGITARPAEYGRRVLAFFDHALLPTDQGGHTMRIEQSFSVSQPPEVVFDYLTNPANLGAWQTSKTSVEQLTTGAPQLGTRVRERTKGPRGKEFDRSSSSPNSSGPRMSTHTSSRGPTPSTAHGRSRPMMPGRASTSSPKVSCPACRGCCSRSRSASSHARWPATTTTCAAISRRATHRRRTTPDEQDRDAPRHEVEVVRRQITRHFTSKPSNGLEPLTPSLPWRCSTS